VNRPFSDGVTAALAGYRLPGCPLAVPSTGLDDEAWDLLLYHAHHQDIIGCLAQAVAEGALPTTPVQRQAVAALHRKMMVSTLQVERSLVEAVTILEEARAEYRAMDGVALAHLAYPDPGWRPFDSIRLLVADRPAAAAALTHAGWGAEQAAVGSDAADRTDLSGPRETQLHLYGRLGYGQAGEAMPASCFQRSIPFTVGGVTVAALTPELLLLRACLDAAFAIRARLRACRDTAQLLARFAVDVESTRRLSRACRMETVVSLALSATSEALGFGEPEPSAEQPATPEAKSDHPPQGLWGWRQAWSSVGYGAIS
jgi:hypothetical protein